MLFVDHHLIVVLSTQRKEEEKKTQLIISLIAMAKNSRTNTKGVAHTHTFMIVGGEHGGSNGGDDDNKCALQMGFSVRRNFRANML